MPIVHRDEHSLYIISGGTCYRPVVSSQTSWIKGAYFEARGGKASSQFTERQLLTVSPNVGEQTGRVFVPTKSKEYSELWFSHSYYSDAFRKPTWEPPEGE